MDRLIVLFESQRFAVEGGIGALVALLFIIACRLVLPAHEKRLVRGPLLLLVLYVVILAVRALLPTEAAAQQTLKLVALFLLLAAAGRSLFLLVVHVIVTRRMSRPLPRIVEDLIQVGVYVAIALVVLRAAGVEPGSLLATSALLTAVIGLSLQDTLGNLFAGLAIQAQRPFEVGDWIKFDENREHVGRVLEINWRATKIYTPDHIEVTVPNSMLAKAAIRNYTKPQRIVRRCVYVVAPYTAPPERARVVLEQAARQTDGVLSDPEASVVVDDFTDSGVSYCVRFFIRDFETRDVIAGDVRERLWYALRRAGWEIPSPQRHVTLQEWTAESQTLERAQAVREREYAVGQVDFLAPLPNDARHRLAKLAETRLYAPGEIIIRQGDPGNELFVVEQGEVSVVIIRDQGFEQEVAVLGPGKFFGEMSLMTGEPRRATVRAKSECQLLVVGKAEFQQIVATNEPLLESISQALSARDAALEHAASSEAERAAAERRSQELLLGKIRRFFSL